VCIHVVDHASTCSYDHTLGMPHVHCTCTCGMQMFSLCVDASRDISFAILDKLQTRLACIHKRRNALNVDACVIVVQSS
jgi:hypothetical protein